MRVVFKENIVPDLRKIGRDSNKYLIGYEIVLEDENFQPIWCVETPVFYGCYDALVSAERIWDVNREKLGQSKYILEYHETWNWVDNTHSCELNYNPTIKERSQAL